MPEIYRKKKERKKLATFLGFTNWTWIYSKKWIYSLTDLMFICQPIEVPYWSTYIWLVPL